MLTVTYVLLWASLLFYGLHLLAGRRRAAWGGTAGVAAAWLVLTGGLAARGVAAGRWPLANRYEFGLCFLWALLGTHLLLEFSTAERRWGSFGVAAALVVATMVLARPVEERGIYPLTPALRSSWLPIHGLTAAVGYGACTLSGALALMTLIHPGGNRSSPLRSGGGPSPPEMGAGETRMTPMGPNGANGQEEPPIRSIRPIRGIRDPQRRAGWPPPEWVERAMGRAAGLGFPWLTLSILTGGIWAEAAWGRYWSWDPKETWSLVVWLAYLLFFHLRATRGWRGRRLAGVLIAATALLLFGYVGFPTLVRLVRLESLHGF